MSCSSGGKRFKADSSFERGWPLVFCHHRVIDSARLGLCPERPGYVTNHGDDDSGRGGPQRITLVASNGVDNVNWQADSTHNITVPFSGTSAVSYLTNFTSITYPYLQYTLQNPLTNRAEASGLKVTVATKKYL